MGVCIKSNFKGSPKLNGGYYMIFKIRSIVAKHWDKEFYEHYKTLLDCRDDWKEWNKRTSEILADDRFQDEDEDLVEFFFMLDTEGKINYKTCGKIYNLIKDTNENHQFAYYSKNDWEDWKTLLKGCYSNRAYLRWD